MRRRSRTTVAAGLQRAIDNSHRPQRPALSCAVPVCRDEVLMAEPVLRAIIRRLTDGRPISQSAVADVRATLVDAYSPLYFGTAPGALRDWAATTLHELDDGLE
jgi:hypothetical protein